MAARPATTAPLCTAARTAGKVGGGCRDPTWRLLAPGPAGSPAKLYLLDQEGLFRWLAAEATWVPLDDGLPAGLPLSSGDLALDPQDPDVLYLATSGQGVYRLDLGASP